MAFDHQVSASVLEALLDCTHDHKMSPSSKNYMSNDVENVLQIIEDCDDNDYVVQIACNILLSCDDLYFKYIDPSRFLPLLLKMLCERYLYNWRLHALLIRFYQISSNYSSTCSYKEIMDAFASEIPHQSLKQLTLWTLSAMCKDINFRKELLIFISQDTSSWISVTIATNSESGLVIPANLECLLKSGMETQDNEPCISMVNLYDCNHV
jgi:hypothetical protein